MSRRLEVEFLTPSCAHVRGYGSRDLLTELRGRAPVRGTLAKAWVTQPHVARDLLAICQARGIDVDVTEAGQERRDPGGGRW
jgi:hypothetical protein